MEAECEYLQSLKPLIIITRKHESVVSATESNCRIPRHSSVIKERRMRWNKLPTVVGYSVVKLSTVCDLPMHIVSDLVADHCIADLTDHMETSLALACNVQDFKIIWIVCVF